MDDELTERGPGDGHDGDEMSQCAREGIGRSIRPGTAVPATVLVAEMDDGYLLLHGWQDGTNAYICPQDTRPLKEALAAACGTADAMAGASGELR